MGLREILGVWRRVLGFLDASAVLLFGRDGVLVMASLEVEVEVEDVFRGVLKGVLKGERKGLESAVAASILLRLAAGVDILSGWPIDGDLVIYLKVINRFSS